MFCFLLLTGQIYFRNIPRKNNIERFYRSNKQNKQHYGYLSFKLFSGPISIVDFRSGCIPYLINLISIIEIQCRLSYPWFSQNFVCICRGLVFKNCLSGYEQFPMDNGLESILFLLHESSLFPFSSNP